GEYERIGGTETLKANARVIAATNREIDVEIESGRFRTDLFYRLNVIHLHLPPLRERYEDILLLAMQFLESFSLKNNKSIRGFSAEATEALNNWRWPGNVRELENVVERAVVLCRDDHIGLDSLPPQLLGEESTRSLQFEVGTPLKTVERRLIEETLRSVGGDKHYL
ncbi:MAG TPA: sigma-54-dependent Fis family transcriptional regulator, partial [Flavobacteriales bacterium]|nr:sigma-54-dependent Fis family transcriptional regulator [Flavobacteriales bacterium]